MGKRYNDIRFECPQGTTQELWTQGTLKIMTAVLGTTIIIKEHMPLLCWSYIAIRNDVLLFTLGSKVNSNYHSNYLSIDSLVFQFATIAIANEVEEEDAGILQIQAEQDQNIMQYLHYQ
ncbi:hypothetical protein BDC45DRAFT_530003 [Circinella umbellata]|nr:hypothetical protein BDC45DRAFT_530003 [Circinella umbellata]